MYLAQQVNRSIINTSLYNMYCGFMWAWMDIKCKYRRSVIGPFWETINVFVMLMGISYISSSIFGGNTLDRLPYIGLGIIIWSSIGSIISDGSSCFSAHKDNIKNSSFDIDLYIYRTVFKVLITSGHHLLLYFIGLLFLPINFSATASLAIIGIGLLFINSIWVIGTLGILCARFRDLEMIVKNAVQILFFMTPVFWDYKSIPSSRSFIIEYNPFFYFIEAIRAPLLGEELPAKHYIVIILITTIGYSLLYLFFKRMRKNLAFYL